MKIKLRHQIFRLSEPVILKITLNNVHRFGVGDKVEWQFVEIGVSLSAEQEWSCRWNWLAFNASTGKTIAQTASRYFKVKDGRILENFASLGTAHDLNFREEVGICEGEKEGENEQ